MEVKEKLKKLRRLMAENGIDVYIIPSGDPHLSEYVADHFKAREWISGFTGSAGTVVVSQTEAGLWTDSRYFLQAEEELKDTGIVLHKVIDRSYANFIKYIVEHYPPHTVVACDGRLFSYGQIESYKKELSAHDIVLLPDKDLISPIWDDRPPLPQNQIFDHPVKYTGVDRKEKISKVRSVMKEKGADYYLMSALDGIAWLLNARGSDIEFNPVFLSFLLVSGDKLVLFMEKKKIPASLLEDFTAAGVSVMPYEDVYDYISALPRGEKLFLDKNLSNYHLYVSIGATVIDGDDIVTGMKAIKNETEIKNLKEAHVQDGVALVRFYMWLEKELQHRPVSEYEAVEKIAYFRSLNPEYVSESFAAIVGYRSNGAIIHYSPDAGNSALIYPEGMLLIDSGGQYFNGTTDITRTTYMGEPPEEAKRNFTLVLKGHIAVATLVYPEGTNGYQIDTFARQYLWRYGLNYYHGTGHGVGFFLNVHEGPQGISYSYTARTKIPLAAGMLNSNEPGYYKDGHYGIRIENLILTVEKENTDFGKFYGHETVTLFPLDTKLIDKKLLTPGEIDWINGYHERVFKALSGFLNEEEKLWLKKKCEKI